LNIIQITHTIEKLKNEEGKKPKHIYVDTEGTKTYSSERSVPLSDVALSILKELYHNQNENLYVFSHDGITISNSRNVTRTLNIMQQHANCKIQKCGPHALRHTFGSYLILKGVDIKTVSELLGHSSIEVTLNVYIHIINAQKASAIKLLDTIQEQKKPLQNNYLLEELQKAGIQIIEIEEGMLGYIQNNKIIKLPINQTVSIENITINNIDIYNEYYKKQD